MVCFRKPVHYEQRGFLRESHRGGWAFRRSESPGTESSQSKATDETNSRYADNTLKRLPEYENISLTSDHLEHEARPKEVFLSMCKLNKQ